MKDSHEIKVRKALHIPNSLLKLRLRDACNTKLGYLKLSNLTPQYHFQYTNKKWNRLKHPESSSTKISSNVETQF